MGVGLYLALGRNIDRSARLVSPPTPSQTMQAESQSGVASYDMDCLHEFMQFTPGASTSFPSPGNQSVPVTPARATGPFCPPEIHSVDGPTQFANLSKSALLSRRTGKTRAVPENIGKHVPPPVHLLAGHMSVESILQ